jgi:chemotaxis receptor (MCP) glutamine deamidase CheD
MEIRNASLAKMMDERDHLRILANMIGEDQSRALELEKVQQQLAVVEAEIVRHRLGKQ